MPNEITELVTEKSKAGYPALYLQSSEDIRAQKEIKVAAEAMNKKLYIWTFGKGLFRDGAKTVVDGTEAPPAVLRILGDTVNPKIEEKSLVILRHFHHFMKDPMVQAKLLDLLPTFKLTNRTLIILSPVVELPAEVEKEFALFEVPLPGETELNDVMDGIIRATGLKGDKLPDEPTRKSVITNAKGLTTSEAENAMALSLVRAKKTGKYWNPQVVMDEKCSSLKKSGLLEYINTANMSLDQIGGMKVLKDWVKRRKQAFTPKAVEFGLPPPKGLLLVGPPGSGKSQAAKAISASLELPLLKCDMGKMFGSLVGQSEANIRKVIHVAEAIAPCVLWIDEIEKGLAGSSSGLDSGVGARVLGTLLTWMQEKEAPVFVYATANDVSALPAELLRKGRFDELFSVLLPNEEERKEIFRIHLKIRGREALIGKGGSKINIDQLSADTAGFSGAEIAQAIVDAMYIAFGEDSQLGHMHLEQALSSTQPLSKTMSEKLTALEAWCRLRTRPANGEEATVQQLMQSTGGRRVEA
jgi:ATP-dependent 26S proteasome regulatory subunit